jgi:hypothetical protein
MNTISIDFSLVVWTIIQLLIVFILVRVIYNIFFKTKKEAGSK